MSLSNILTGTMRSYDKFAETYRNLHSDPGEVRRQLDQFVALLKGRTVLDLGCGHGRDLRSLSSHGLRTIGVDLSEKLLRMAKADRSSEVARMDMRLLGFHSKVFDGLWVCASLLHLPKSEAGNVLDEFYRVLRPEGLFFVSVKEGDFEGTIETHPGLTRFFSFYRMEELQVLLSRRGFRVTESYKEKKKDIIWLNIFARRK
jgi:SAM-dependent methyltransferase